MLDNKPKITSNKLINKHKLHKYIKINSKMKNNYLFFLKYMLE